MPKVVAEYRSQARDRIVAAAQTVFHRLSFSRATMDDIAREVGVSKGALYRYFRSKSELLAEIQRRNRGRILARWESLLDGGDVAEGIVNSIDQLFSGEVDPSIWVELIGAAAGDPSLRAAMRLDQREDRRMMRDFLKRLEERGRIRPVRDRKVVAEIVLTVLAGSVVEIILHGSPNRTRRELVRTLRHLLPAGR